VVIEARFKPGDMVEVTSSGGGKGAVWEVVEEDTNKAGVLDRQPAYKLRRWVGGSWNHRYIYQSDIEPAPEPPEQ
jgi:hypothetical protein